jgi:putative ABC transport system ATP-binding protein
MPLPVIRLEGVSKVFRTEAVETLALSEITMEILPGEFVAVAGPSGAGKSTLLSVLGLLETPTAGECYLHGQPTRALGARERARLRNREIGFIFQAFHLIGDLTVYENVELPLLYRGVALAERRRRVEEALERVGLSDRRHHYPFQLAGGQQQRVAVARAIVGRPSVLLADEPTGNLDSRNGLEVMELLRQLHRDGATLCMVTHDPRYVSFAQRTLHLFDGRLVESEAALEPSTPH